MKVKVDVRKWDDGRLDKLVIYRRGRPLTLQYLYDSDGLQTGAEFDGRRADMPSVVEIAQIIDESWLERIGLIKKIGTIEKMELIRDTTWRPLSFIVNPMFDQEFTGWLKYGNPEHLVAEGTLTAYARSYVRFHANQHEFLYQDFPVPLEVDALTALYVEIRSDIKATPVINVSTYYTDKNVTITALSLTNEDTWENKTLSPTAGKYISGFEIRHLSTQTARCDFSKIVTVF